MGAPRTPADVPQEITETALVRCFAEHRAALVDHRHAIGGRVLPAEEVVSHALAELATATALAERVTAGRWVVSVQALEHGATVADVAAAQGLDPSEVRIGLVSWADGQRRYCGMTEEQHVAVLALVGER